MDMFSDVKSHVEVLLFITPQLFSRDPLYVRSCHNELCPREGIPSDSKSQLRNFPTVPNTRIRISLTVSELMFSRSHHPRDCTV